MVPVAVWPKDLLINQSGAVDSKRGGGQAILGNWQTVRYESNASAMLCLLVHQIYFWCLTLVKIIWFASYLWQVNFFRNFEKVVYFAGQFQFSVLFSKDEMFTNVAQELVRNSATFMIYPPINIVLIIWPNPS